MFLTSSDWDISLLDLELSDGNVSFLSQRVDKIKIKISKIGFMIS